MKAIYKSLLAAALVVPSLTGCIEEAFPTSSIIQEQLEGSPKAVEALVWAMPGHFNVIGTVSTAQHYDFGYPSIMHSRDMMTADMHVPENGYNWFSAWSTNSLALGMEYMVCQYSWNYYYEQILTTNSAVGAIDEDTDNAELNFLLGTSLANRAMVYLDAARQYEFLPTEFNEGRSSEGNVILGLTMPIVTEKTTEEEMNNNPRVHHNDMVAFIKGDLEKAIEYFKKGTGRPEKTLPNIAVAYGLMARLYLWDASYQEECGDKDLAFAAEALPHAEAAGTPAELYAKAAEYAKMAYTTHGASTVTTRDEWLDRMSGFNTISTPSWMLGGQYVTEDDAVQAGGIRTWTSFMSPEHTFGYASPAQGAWPEISASLYGSINDRDFRKLTFKAPEGSQLAKQVPYLDPEFAEENFDAPYIAIKFRPGQGNMDDYTVGACVAYPLMRVEEMYFIEAEAVAHTDPAAGMKLCSDFMKAYRYATYKSGATTMEDVVSEIVLQKRIELWGEGQSFFDIKRLNMSCTRFYSGTNFESGVDTFNTNGRAGWMNAVIVSQEVQNNTAIEGYNTPSSAPLYKAIN